MQDIILYKDNMMLFHKQPAFSIEIIIQTCVVFPDPVSPTNTRHWFLFNVSINLSLYSQTGSVVRFLYNSQYLGANGNPAKYLPNVFHVVHSTHNEKHKDQNA